MPTTIDYRNADLTTLLSDKNVQHLLDVAEQHPDWTILQMVGHLPKNVAGKPTLSYNEARDILRRLHLQTVVLRQLRNARLHDWEQASQHKKQTIKDTIPEFIPYLKYRQAYKQAQQQQRVHPQSIQLQTPAQTVTPQLSYTPEKLATFKTFDRFFFLSRQFSSVITGALLFLLIGSLLLDYLFNVQGFLQKIGMFFSFAAFVFGLFFLLYSLKYYLTIAILLSFSRGSQEDTQKPKGILPLALKVFGIAIKTKEEKITAKQPAPSTPPASLSFDLSSVTLERCPFVSIHVATYNEKRVIDRFLLAATAMEYDNYEIIVADDSNDETVKLLEQWRKHPRIKISHRDTREGYKGAALQKALEVMDKRTEYVLVFDADFIPYPDSITQFLKYFQAACGSLTPKSSTIAAVQGYQWHMLNKSENWITRGVRTEYAGSYVIERSGTEIYQGLKQISGSVYMIRADVLKTIGWGTSITEDFELTLRLYANGYKVLYTPYIQTPAEAVSTIKRLLHQRMRWAEGHSFNVKKMYSQLLASPNLTPAEKFEFLYLAPYYLQAFFFILGSLSWFTAEIIFRVTLPFWTEVWGWSLVLTNLFALPLMNMVGMFMENSDEKDYSGLFSFVLLSYIVAPFQAFAAVKGFLENEEGPWFRTPKTGKITDNFSPGRFYRFVSGILGKSEYSFHMNPGLKFQTTFIHNPYISDNNIRKFSPKDIRSRRWRSRSLLAAYLLIAFFLNYVGFFMPKQAIAAGNPTIEQQISIVDWPVTSVTDYGIAYIEPSAYSGTLNYSLEVLAKAATPNGTVVVKYDAGTTNVVNASTGTNVTFTINSTSYNLYSSNITPSGGNIYLYSISGGGTTTVAAARVKIIQTAPIAINNTQTEIGLGSDELSSNSNTTDSPVHNPIYWKYDQTKYDGTVQIFVEATVKNSGSSKTSTITLYEAGATCNTPASGVTGTVQSMSGSTYNRLRTGDISGNLLNQHTYMFCEKTSNGGGVYPSNFKIIVKQTST